MNKNDPENKAKMTITTPPMINAKRDRSVMLEAGWRQEDVCEVIHAKTLPAKVVLVKAPVRVSCTKKNFTPISCPSPVDFEPGAYTGIEDAVTKGGGCHDKIS